jgi:hypothetical protein
LQVRGWRDPNRTTGWKAWHSVNSKGTTIIIVYSTYSSTILLPGLLGRQRPSVRKNSCKCKFFGLIMAGGVRAFVGRLQKKAVGDFLNKFKKENV